MDADVDVDVDVDERGRWLAQRLSPTQRRLLLAFEPTLEPQQVSRQQWDRLCDLWVDDGAGDRLPLARVEASRDPVEGRWSFRFQYRREALLLRSIIASEM